MANIALQLQRMADQNTAKQMDWQERMSNTAHQREVADLQAAGLNPVLSSGGSGAQSYSTSVDSAVNALGGIEQARLSSAATVQAARLNYAATKYSVDNNIVTNPLGYGLNGSGSNNLLSKIKNFLFNSNETSAKKIRNSGLSKSNPLSSGLTGLSRKNNNDRRINGEKLSISTGVNPNLLSSKQKKYVAEQLSKYGLKNNFYNQTEYLKFYVTGDYSYLNALRRNSQFHR